MSGLGPGSKIGRFEISAVLGQGAMGTVFLAHDPQIERPVAIKTLRPSDRSGELEREIQSRFLKEAKLAGRLQHPNVVTIYEAGQDGDVSYIAMEYVDGDPLGQFLARRQVSVSERLGIVRQVALALEHAHERGVLHRDIKPGNILVTHDGQVKVADFGIGKLLSGAGDLTRTGQMIGSPAYMSPEQIRGGKLDGRSDLFSLGVVLYELLTGSRPFPGNSITTLVYQILHTEPRDPLEVRADLPASTRDVLARLLAKAPEKRPSDAAGFLRELRRIESGSPDERTLPFAPMTSTQPPREAPPPGLPPPPTLPARPEPSQPPPVREDEVAKGARPGAVYLFGVAAVLLAAAALIAIWRRTDHPAAGGAPTPAIPAAGGYATPGAAAAGELAPTRVPAIEVAPPTPGGLPTAGSARAADASVGASRYSSGAAPTRTPRISIAESRPTEEEPAILAAPANSSVGGSAPADNVYRTRRYAKFGVSPDQARIYVDGRYVGIADDWDDRGGGKTLELTREGRHRVRLELPGYRTLNLDVIATPGAPDETVDIGDELKRESKVAYPKFPKVEDRTVGPVELRVNPPDAVVTERGQTLGVASSFGPGSPLKLSGPMVHELELSAPGRKSKTIRILVASNADRDVAKVKVELKKE